MKKLLCFFVFAVCLALFGVTAFAAAGDIDADDSVTATDARLALRMSVDLEPALSSDPEKTAAADADLDGSVTAMDARLILRASVELVDLSEILPESARLTEEELAEKYRQSLMIIRKDLGDEVHESFGFLISSDGKLLTTFDAVRGAESLQVSDLQGKKYEISSVQCNESEGLVLMQLNGTFDVPAVNRTDYSEGSAVYSFYASGTVWTFEQGIIYDLNWKLPNSEQPESFFIRTTMTGEISKIGMPMMDAYGRFMCILSNVYLGWANGISITEALRRLDGASPMTVKELCEKESGVTLTVPLTEAKVFTGANVFCPVIVQGRKGYDLRCASDSGCVRAELRNDGCEYVLITALKPNQTATVTVWASGHWATRVEIHVQVVGDEDEALVVFAGTPIPDFGALNSRLPDSSGYQENGNTAKITQYYRFNDNDDVIAYLETYAYWLEQLGFVCDKNDSMYEATGANGIETWEYHNEEYGVTLKTELSLQFVSDHFVEDGVEYFGYYYADGFRLNAEWTIDAEEP
ncbi:MAG: hypothetical protein IJJ85_02410 [Clostridia bacterium]|nr:hypothetical protein [Clostridia bacterium]